MSIRNMLELWRIWILEAGMCFETVSFMKVFKATFTLGRFGLGSEDVLTLATGFVIQNLTLISGHFKYNLMKL